MDASAADPVATAPGSDFPREAMNSREAVNMSFASKVIGYLRFGFAAGCAAVAMPCRNRPDCSGLCPRLGLSPSDFMGQRPHEGHSPKVKS